MRPTSDHLWAMTSAYPGHELRAACAALLPWRRLEVQVRYTADRRLGVAEEAVHQLVRCGVRAPGDIAELLAIPLPLVHRALRTLAGFGALPLGGADATVVPEPARGDPPPSILDVGAHDGARVDREVVLFDTLLWAPVPMWLAEATTVAETCPSDASLLRVPARRTRPVSPGEVGPGSFVAPPDAGGAPDSRGHVVAVSERETIEQVCAVGVLAERGRRRTHVSIVVAGTPSPQHDGAFRTLPWAQSSAFVDQVFASSEI